MAAFEVVAQSTETGEPVLVVRGDLDIMSSAIFQSAAHAAMNQHRGSTLRLDLHQVEFIDSSGIDALIKLRSAVVEHGGVLDLAASSRYVERVLDLVGIAEMFG